VNGVKVSPKHALYVCHFMFGKCKKMIKHGIAPKDAIDDVLAQPLARPESHPASFSVGRLGLVYYK
jgi:hypothetical protein